MTSDYWRLADEADTIASEIKADVAALTRTLAAEIDEVESALAAAKTRLAILTQTGLYADGIRDPNAPCSAFARGTPAPAPMGDCETDGHYICDECVRRVTCDGCGKRWSGCECPSYPDETIDNAFERALARGAT